MCRKVFHVHGWVEWRHEVLWLLACATQHGASCGVQLGAQHGVRGRAKGDGVHARVRDAPWMRSARLRIIGSAPETREEWGVGRMGVSSCLVLQHGSAVYDGFVVITNFLELYLR